MQIQGANILDLIHSLPAVTTEAPKVSATDPDVLTFEQLLGELAPKVSLPEAPIQLTAPEESSPLLPQEAPIEEELPAGQHLASAPVSIPQLLNLPNVDIVQTGSESAEPQQMDLPDAVPIIPARYDGTSGELPAVSPARTPGPDKLLIETDILPIDAEKLPIDLKTFSLTPIGRFAPGTETPHPEELRVLRTDVSGEKLHVTVAPKGETSKPIEITAPLSQVVVEDDNRVQSHAARVRPIERQPMGDLSKYEEYFTKANVREIHIKDSGVAENEIRAATPPDEPRQLTQPGIESSPPVQVDRQQVLQVPENQPPVLSRLSPGQTVRGESPAAPIDLPDPTEDAQEHQIESPEGKSDQPDKPTAVPLQKQRTAELTREEIPPAPRNINESVVKEGDFLTEGKTSGNTSTSAPEVEQPQQRLEPQSIRFSLPDDLAKTLKPNGPTVQLRIEPEHLGPARLSLVMHDDKLRARVIVSDAVAKAAVESSLDRLVDQLGKNNIQVERIEVTISGEQMPDSGGDRRPVWFRQQPFAPRFTFYDEPDQQGAAMAAPTVRPSMLYINPQSVNVLA
ncbi:MAG: flagellar hook-length control protein FliK [Candidatus Zixiibacteriota bacterium]